MVQGLLIHRNWKDTRAYRVVFAFYAFLGVIKFVLSLMLSDKCEVEPPQQKYEPVGQELDSVEAEGLLSVDEDTPEPSPKLKTAEKLPAPSKKSLWPAISPASRSILVKLCLLFAVDSLASGLIPASWITYFFSRKFSVSEGTLGTLFFTTNIISSASNLVASSIAKRIGLVKTMVLTHLPSAIFLSLIPLPTNVGISMAFLILRSCTQSMDQAPRQAFLAAAVLPSERTAVMGVVNVIKTLSQSGGPLVTGWLSGIGKFWIAFLVAGAMKAAYDLAMLKMFLGYKSREEEQKGGPEALDREVQKP